MSGINRFKPEFRADKRKINPKIAKLVEDEIAHTNFDNRTQVDKLARWINGVAIPETDKVFRAELIRLKVEINEMFR